MQPSPNSVSHTTLTYSMGCHLHLTVLLETQLTQVLPNSVELCVSTHGSVVPASTHCHDMLGLQSSHLKSYQPTMLTVTC